MNNGVRGIYLLGGLKDKRNHFYAAGVPDLKPCIALRSIEVLSIHEDALALFDNSLQLDHSVSSDFFIFFKIIARTFSMLARARSSHFFRLPSES